MRYTGKSSSDTLPPDKSQNPSSEVPPAPLPLKEWGEKLIEAMTRGLNKASFESAARYGLPGGRRPYDYLYLHRVAKPETLQEIKYLDRRSKSIADGWAQISPDQVRKLEADGLLLQQLDLQADAEVAAIANARMEGLKLDVPDSEQLEMAGVDADLHLHP